MRCDHLFPIWKHLKAMPREKNTKTKSHVDYQRIKLKAVNSVLQNALKQSF